MPARALERFVRRLRLSSDPLNPESLATFFRLPEIILNLLVEPAFRGRVEGDREPNRHFRTDAASTIENCRETLPTNT